MTLKCYLNIIDNNYYIIDESGFKWGIGETAEEAVENAEFNGADCTNLQFEDMVI